MNYPGEHPAGILRSTVVQCPVVGGYVTARLQVMGEPGTVQVSGFSPNATMVAATNTGGNSVTFRLQGTDDYTLGPWEWVGGALTLVPSGGTNVTVYPRHHYLELAGQTGTSTVRVQFSSRLRWNELGFAKTDPRYPPSLWTVKNPLATSV